jgi:HTH-type transcriptional regulator / antitoxin HigA
MNAEQISQSWQKITFLLIPIANEEDCNIREEQLNNLIKLNEQKKDPQISYLINRIALTIQEYEKQEFPLEKATGIEVLQYLMTEHNLTESDLPEIGNKKLICDLLNGKKELTLTMIKALARRFQVTERTFLG